MAIYEKFIGRNRDSFESLEDAQKNYKITYPDNFNYAFDVIDELAKTKPNKLAMIWVSKDETEEKRFTFRDLMKLSNKAANYFISLGIWITCLFIAIFYCNTIPMWISLIVMNVLSLSRNTCKD